MLFFLPHLSYWYLFPESIEYYLAAALSLSAIKVPAGSVLKSLPAGKAWCCDTALRAEWAGGGVGRGARVPEGVPSAGGLGAAVTPSLTSGPCFR